VAADHYNTPARLAALSTQPGLGQASNHYDELTAQKLLYGTRPRAEEGGEGEGGLSEEERELVDNHYDAITGENFYETVDNVRLAIQQNALNERQEEEEEERYVPFKLDGPPQEV
jgi:hypothetical protein